MNDLERKFNSDMQNIYNIAKKDLGYISNSFLHLISEKGWLQAAKTLISKNGGTYGFEVLWENNRLDLSIEAHVLKQEHISLFTDEDLAKDIYNKKIEILF